MTKSEFLSLQRGDKVRFIGPNANTLDKFISGVTSLGKRYIPKKVYTLLAYYRPMGGSPRHDFYFYRMPHGFSCTISELDKLASHFELVEKRYEQLESKKHQRNVKKNLRMFRDDLTSLIERNKLWLDGQLSQIPTADLITFTQNLDQEHKQIAQFLHYFKDLSDIIKDQKDS